MKKPFTNLVDQNLLCVQISENVILEIVLIQMSVNPM